MYMDEDEDIELALDGVFACMDGWTDAHAARLANALVEYVQQAPTPDSPHSRDARRRLRSYAEELTEMPAMQVPASPVKAILASSNPEAHDARASAEPAVAPAVAPAASPAVSPTARKRKAPGDTPHAAALRQFHTIADRIVDRRVNPEELSALAINGVPAGKLADVEISAFVRLYRGYMLPENVGSRWGLFGEDEAPASAADIIAMCRASMALSQRSLSVRLSQRCKARFNDPSGTSWLLNLIHKIEALMYQLDCDEQASGVGGTARLRKLIATQFKDWAGAEESWTHVDLNDKTAPDYDKAYKAFNKVRSASLRSSMRSVCLYQRFGPGILIDPMWTFDTCFHSRSKTFPHLMDILSHDDPAGYSLSDVYADTLVALYSLSQYLGGPVVRQYVEGFVAAYPSRVVAA